MKTSIANHSIILDGIKLAYYKSSIEHDQTVILLHGYCGSSKYFHKLIPQLESFSTVIAFDLVGHGQSGALADEKYTLEHVAGFIHRALVQMKIKSFYLFGHSLGGYITLAYANRYRDNLKGFGLINSTALPDSVEAKRNRLNVIESVRQNGVEGFVTQLATKLFGEHAVESDIALVREIGMQTSVEGVVGFAHAMREREETSNVIYSSPIPVLLVAGQQDKIVTPEAVFTGHQDKTVCVEVRNAGHMVMLEAAETHAEIIQQFVCH